MIDDMRVWPAAVVEAGEGDAKFLLLPDQIEDSAWCEWAFVDAMERADGSGWN
jgi:hypothetical protein